MKKIFTLIATALMAVSANAQETQLSLAAGWGTTIEDALTGDVVFNYKNAYCAVNLISEEVDLTKYKGYELVLSDDTPFDKLQFAIKSDSPNGNDDGYNWSGSFDSATPDAFIPEGATKLLTIEVQACNVADLGKVEIKSFNLIDNDGNKVPTIYVAPASWAGDVLSPVTSGTINYTEGKQWQSFGIKGAEGTINKRITLTVAEPFPSDMQFAVQTTERNEGANSIYAPCTEGETVAYVDAKEEVAGETIQAIVVQNTVERAPFKIKVLSVVMTDLNTDGVAAVTAAKAQPAVRYNLAGQQVAAGYKGIVIENGKKFVVK